MVSRQALSEGNNDGDCFDNSSTDTKVRVGLEQVNSKTEYSAMFGDKHCHGLERNAWHQRL